MTHISPIPRASSGPWAHPPRKRKPGLFLRIIIGGIGLLATAVLASIVAYLAWAGLETYGAIMNPCPTVGC